VIDRVSAAVRAAVADATVRNRLVGVGVEPGYLDTSGFNRFIDEETVKAEKYVASLPATK
jgi:tripartite-type tricarboxylate transporter receptor subunit TctC